MYIVTTAPAYAASPPLGRLVTCATDDGAEPYLVTYAGGNGWVGIGYFPAPHLVIEDPPPDADGWEYCPLTLTLTTSSGEYTAEVMDPCSGPMDLTSQVLTDITATSADLDPEQEILTVSLTYRIIFSAGGAPIASDPGGSGWVYTSLTVPANRTVDDPSSYAPDPAFPQGASCS